jgi:uncharacterized protein (TIRG00374 family)
VHLTLAAALLALLIWRADVERVGDVLSEADVLPVLAVVAIDAPVLFLLFVRARFVLGVLGHDVPAQVLMPVSILGNVAGSLTPASAGELLRAGVLHTHAEVSAEDALALVVYERGMSVYLLGLSAGVTAAFVALPLWAAFCVAAAGALLVLLPMAVSPVLRFLPGMSGERRGRIGRALDALAGAAGQLRHLLRDGRLLLRWGAVTAVVFALNGLQCWLLARSVGGGIDLAEAWVAFGASQLAGAASLLPLGLGAVDGSLAGILQKLGQSLDESAAVAVLLRLTTTLPLGIVAVGSYFYLLSQTPERRETDSEKSRRMGPAALDE